MIYRLTIRRVAVAASAYLAFTALFLCHSLQPAESQTSAETPKQVYQEKCSACHNAYDPTAEAMTLAQWRSTVNRMLYRHGASMEISPVETQTILTYLATFAVPEPAHQAGRPGISRRVDNSDVWAAQPSYSRVFVFGADASLAPTIRPASAGIAWKILSDSGARQLAMRAKDNVDGPDLLLLPVPTETAGGLRLEAVFTRAQLASGTPAPLSFGLAFGSHMSGGSREYDLVRYDATQGIVDLVATNGKATRSILSKTLDRAQSTGSVPAERHTLRVDVLGNRVKAWLDYSKALDTALPQPAEASVAGVWTGSRAGVQSVAVDFYPAPG